MKKFALDLAEVAKAVSPGDKEFIAIHKIKTTTEDGVTDATMKGTVGKDKTRKADKPAVAGQTVDESVIDEGKKGAKGKPDITVDDEGADKDSQAMAEEFASELANIEGLTEAQIEALTELSKSTLSSYKKKASGQVNRIGKVMSAAHADLMHTQGAGPHGEAAAKKINSVKGKFFKRRAGVEAASKRLATEGVEIDELVTAIMFELDEQELQELSKKTLGSYVKQAAYSADHASAKAMQDGAMKKDTLPHHRTRYKRHDGIAQAVKRLTREGLEATHVLIAQLNQLDEEELDEVSKETLSNFIEKAAKRKSHAAGIAKAAKKIGALKEDIITESVHMKDAMSNLAAAQGAKYGSPEHKKHMHLHHVHSATHYHEQSLIGHSQSYRDRAKELANEHNVKAAKYE